MLDIGANVGFYGLITQKYFPNMEIHSFEPTPSTYNQLNANVQLNSLEARIHTHNLALSDSAGSAEFLDFDNLSGKNGISDTTIHNPSPASKILVDTARLDELQDRDGTSIAIKVDTEGHERSVLAGSRAVLTNNSCFLQIETGHGRQNDEVDELLVSLGYQNLFRLGPDRYYSNVQSLISASTKLELVERVCGSLINYRWTRQIAL